ncbi:MAG TPA: histidine kinase [Euzebyales bacterium]|nr:histidine kinase [Euzebyales bacterium]
MRIRRSARDWRVDIGLTTVAATLGGLFLLGTLAEFPLSPLAVTVDIVAGCGACAAVLLVRRRWPVGLALALASAPLVSAVAMGAAVVSVFGLAVHRPWRRTIPIVALHMCVIAGTFLLAYDDRSDYWEPTLTLLTLYVAATSSGMFVRAQRQLLGSLRDRAQQAEEQQRLRVEEARHLERERLAREMHDVLAHRISLLAVHAGALEIRRSAPAEEHEAARTIRQSAFQALEDLREVIGMLRHDEATADGQRPQPALTDLPTLVDQSRRAGMSITVDDRLTALPAIPASIGRHVYRVVQEGLTNARKHAPGADVGIVLDAEPGSSLTVEITNVVPAGGTPARIPGAGTGLIGLRERMHLIGGRLEHGPTVDGGYRLLAWLPWRSGAPT